MKLARIFGAFLVALAFAANAINAEEIGNGEAAIIVIKDEFASKLTIDGRPAKWFAHPAKKGYKVAFFSASYRAKKDIKVKNGDAVNFGVTIFKLAQRPYKKEMLSVEPAKVNPPKTALARIKAEYKEASKVYANPAPKLLFNSKFEMPLNSKITSPFGTARMFNGSLKSYHSGMDYRAAVGVEIRAANAGIVRIAKDRYYAGNSVVIDHGGGIFTQYYHLSKIAVKVGQKVEKGELLGLSGASGRVSGPHLHFGVMVGGSQVNPLDFVNKVNMLFD